MPVKSVKHVEHINPLTKPIVNSTVLEVVRDLIKQFSDIEHVITKTKPKITRKDFRQEKPAHADPMHGLPFAI